MPRFATGEFGQPDPFQPAVRGLVRGPPVDALTARAERHVVPGGEVREQQIVLEDHADPAVLGRGGREIPPVDPEEPVGERRQPGQRAQGGGLAGAVRPEQRDRLAAGDGELDIQPELAAVHNQVRVEKAHGAVNQRSRRAARIVTDTASRIRLSTTAPSRSPLSIVW